MLVLSECAIRQTAQFRRTTRSLWNSRLLEVGEQVFQNGLVPIGQQFAQARYGDIRMQYSQIRDRGPSVLYEAQPAIAGCEQLEPF